MPRQMTGRAVALSFVSVLKIFEEQEDSPDLTEASGPAGRQEIKQASHGGGAAGQRETKFQHHHGPLPATCFPRSHCRRSRRVWESPTRAHHPSYRGQEWVSLLSIPTSASTRPTRAIRAPERIAPRVAQAARRRPHPSLPPITARLSGGPSSLSVNNVLPIWPAVSCVFHASRKPDLLPSGWLIVCRPENHRERQLREQNCRCRFRLLLLLLTSLLAFSKPIEKYLQSRRPEEDGKPPWSFEDQRQRLLRHDIPLLKVSMGLFYHDAVKICIEGDFGRKEDNSTMTGKQVLFRFSELVITRLSLGAYKTPRRPT